MAELAAIHSLLSGTQCRPYITANKSCIGHLLGAAGGVESAFSALSILENIIPPTINIFNKDKSITKDLCIVEEKCFRPEEQSVPSSLPSRLVIKNSFGFGGTNVSLLFAQYKE